MSEEHIFGNPDDPVFRRIVGLDLSLRCTGLVALDKTGKVHWAKTEGKPLMADATQREKLERMHDIAKFVIEGVRKNCFSVIERGGSPKPWVFQPAVVIEGYAYSRGGGKKKDGGGTPGAVFDLAELGGIVKSNLFLAFGIEVYIVVSSQARKAVVGKGRPTKAEVVECANANGLPSKNHNIGDAWVCAEWLRREKYEKDQ